MNISMLNPGVERQVGTSLEDIRDDHKERYIWASERLTKSDDVLDAGCGVGYGSALLAERASSVYAIDISEDAIAYANKYWAKPNISHAVEDLCFFAVASSRRYDAIVAFEVVEHLIEPRLFLMRAFDALKSGGRIFVSVPNEKVIPHTVSLNPFHLKHYTAKEIRDLMLECGFEVKEVASQNTKEIAEGDSGRFMILEARRHAKRPIIANGVELSQHALTQAANFVVARAMAIHKATKDIKTLKSRLEEANKTIASSEPRSESQLKLLQFFEGFQAQAHASQGLLVSDLLRRVKELESLERKLRERTMQAELQRTKVEEELRFALKNGAAYTEAMSGISADLSQAKSEIDHHQTEILRLKNELMQSELTRLRAEDSRQLAQQKCLDQHEAMGQLSTDLAQTTQKCQVLSNELAHALREKDAQGNTAAQERHRLEAELAGWKNQFDKALTERDALTADCTHLQSDMNNLQDELAAVVQLLQTEKQLNERTLAQLEEHLAQSESAQAALAHEVDSLRATNVALHQSHIQLEKQTAQLQIDLSIAIDRLSQERDDFNVQLERQSTKFQIELSVTISQLEKERDNIAAQLNERLAQANDELSAATARFETERKDMEAQLDTSKKLASQAKDKRDAMGLRLLAVGQDNQLIMAANEELIQKLQAAETEASRLNRSVSILRSELQTQTTTASKGPPTLGKIYSKLRIHRFYLPFFYKAVRNSLRNQTNRFRAKA
jgi:SAM-dependent methyltransferase